MYLTQYFLAFNLLTIVSLVPGELMVEKVADPVVHGEGPHWDDVNQVLYYVDIVSQKVVKYDPKTQEMNQVFIEGGPVGFVVSDRNNNSRFVVGRGLDLVEITWDGKSSTPSSMVRLASVDQDKPENRFNDGKVDASGRLWAGTMGPENPDIRLDQGSLYSFEWSDEFKPQKHLSPVSISNGIAWSNDNDRMYYIDSPSKVISVFDFDIKSGKLSNRRDFFNLADNNIPGNPDGMTIDRRGNLWVAVYKGQCLLHIDGKKGTLLQKVHFPVSQVTSCAFGGEDLKDLYVTTSRKDLSEEELRNQPLAGALFKVTGTNVLGQKKSDKIITGP